jgi:hypothetical protein
MNLNLRKFSVLPSQPLSRHTKTQIVFSYDFVFLALLPNSKEGHPKHKTAYHISQIYVRPESR